MNDLEHMSKLLSQTLHSQQMTARAHNETSKELARCREHGEAQSIDLEQCQQALASAQAEVATKHAACEGYAKELTQSRLANKELREQVAEIQQQHRDDIQIIKEYQTAEEENNKAENNKLRTIIDELNAEIMGLHQ